MNERKSTAIGRDPRIPAGVAGSSGNYSDNVVFQGRGGHGFAGERANHLADVLSGQEAEWLDGDYHLDGADRVLNGFEIQSKYHRTGSACVSACFRDGRFRYAGNHGPMLIEVPSDKYDAAVQTMQHRISTRQVALVASPDQYASGGPGSITGMTS